MKNHEKNNDDDENTFFTSFLIMPGNKFNFIGSIFDFTKINFRNQIKTGSLGQHINENVNNSIKINCKIIQKMN